MERSVVVPADVVRKLKDRHGAIRTASIRMPHPVGASIGFAFRVPKMIDWEKAEARAAVGESMNEALAEAVIVHPATEGVMAQLRERPYALRAFIDGYIGPYYGTGARIVTKTLDEIDADEVPSTTLKDVVDQHTIKGVVDQHGAGVRWTVITLPQPVGGIIGFFWKEPTHESWEKAEAQAAVGGNRNEVLAHAVIVHPDRAKVMAQLKAAPVALRMFGEGEISPFFGVGATISIAEL